MLAGIRLALCACAVVMLSGVAAAEAPLLPRPAAVVEQAGAFTLAGARIAAGDDGAKAAAGRLGELLARAGHKPLPISAKGTIRFLRDPAIEGGEAYRLVIAPDGITVSASTDAGLYYGAETLWQLILAAPDGRLAAMRIDDIPAFAWRGVMLDSARHFQPVAYVKQLIDRMAMVKLNRLHWHLTDDQGWRLPVPGYPRLTTVGAGGQFYSEAEIREVVAYAAQHHVEIVPEVDMPGHFTAAVAAYPWLASTPVPPTAPSGEWGILPNLINPDAKGMAFVEAVLDQLMALFPGKVIHIGGDEAVKDQWNANPAIQAQIKALGLKDAEALQAWFTGRVTAYLEAHGRRAIGWDEILGGPLPGDAVVMSWRGIDGAIAAARAGHDTVLAPAPVFYLDNRQSASDREPPGRGEIIDWKRLYQAEIAPPSLTASEKAHILGLQVNLWTEHVRTTDFATRMIWPRADVLAEMGWAGAQRDWNAFVPRLLAQMRRERQLGLAADRVPLEAMAKFEPGAGDTIRASLRQPAAIGTMRYTIDGTAPGAASPAYAGPLDLVPGTVLNAQAFAGTEPLGEPQRWTIAAALTRTASGNDMELCTDQLPLRMEDDVPSGGARQIHFVDVMDPCWIWRGAPLDRIRRIVATVAHRPYNLSLGDALTKVRIEQAGADGDMLRIQLDGCAGPVIARLPLNAGVADDGNRRRLEVALGTELTGQRDLCITFAQKGTDPLWMLDRLTLEP